MGEEDFGYLCQNKRPLKPVSMQGMLGPALVPWLPIMFMPMSVMIHSLGDIWNISKQSLEIWFTQTGGWSLTFWIHIRNPTSWISSNRGDHNYPNHVTAQHNQIETATKKQEHSSFLQVKNAKEEVPGRNSFLGTLGSNTQRWAVSLGEFLMILGLAVALLQ